MARRFWIETLGCPKNQVDSDKLVGTLLADGMQAASAPETADLVVVNTCAFIEEARQESIDVVLALSGRRREGAEVVVTGCLAERHGDELAAAIPEVSVRGFGVPVVLGRAPKRNSFEYRMSGVLPLGYCNVRFSRYAAEALARPFDVCTKM